MIVSRNTIFFEKQFIQDGGIGRIIKLKKNISQEQRAKEPEEPNQSEPVLTQPFPPRRSTKIFHPHEKYLGTIQEEVEEMFLTRNGAHGDDPKTYDEVISDIDSEKWLEAMRSEIDSMHSNQIWTLVDPPEGIVPIGCKQIFKRKIGTYGKVETFKVRLVAKGFRQRQGVNYEETFSPVAMLKSILILLAITIHYNYKV